MAFKKAGNPLCPSGFGFDLDRRSVERFFLLCFGYIDMEAKWRLGEYKK